MIVVTGANGKLGTLVIQGLLKAVPPDQIVAAVRSPEKADALHALGVQVRKADYTQPETLRTALEGAEKVLLISGTDLGNRVPQHRAVIDAARAAGVKLLAYTSLLRAATSTLNLAKEHKATEEYLQASGVPFVVLGNGWYLENHTENLAPALEHGAILGSAGEGRFAAASRKDYADAAVTVLTTEGHAGRIYDLAGDESYTKAELAAEVSKQAGKTVVYQDLPEAKYAGILAGFGLPIALAEMLADSDAGAGRGELDSDARDLSSLIGHSTEMLQAAVKAALETK